jgi:hypothetical protein
MSNAPPAAATTARPDNAARRQQPGLGARRWGREGCIGFTSEKYGTFVSILIENAKLRGDVGDLKSW